MTGEERRERVGFVGFCLAESGVSVAIKIKFRVEQKEGGESQ